MKNINVLFLCTHNSGRSILAEYVLNNLKHSSVKGFSAGSTPRRKINPLVSDMISEEGNDTNQYKPKTWDEFSTPDSPNIDIVITLCDSASKETCPVWPGKPVTVHWGYPDPSTQTSLSFQEQKKMFIAIKNSLEKRLKEIISLPLDKMNSTEIQKTLTDIGNLDEKKFS
jgi:arsenate reductase